MCFLEVFVGLLGVFEYDVILRGLCTLVCSALSRMTSDICPRDNFDMQNPKSLSHRPNSEENIMSESFRKPSQRVNFLENSMICLDMSKKILLDILRNF